MFFISFNFQSLRLLLNDNGSIIRNIWAEKDREIKAQDAAKRRAEQAARRMGKGLNENVSMPDSKGDEQIKVAKNAPEPVKTILTNLTCKICLEGFDFPSDLDRHSKGTNCINLPCKIAKSGHVHGVLVNIAFSTEAEAQTYLRRNYPLARYQFSSPNNDYHCRHPTCQSKLRIRKSRRFLTNGQLSDVFAVLGCTCTHSNNAPIKGYCKTTHIHELYYEHFDTRDNASNYVKNALMHHYKSKNYAKDHQEVFTCKTGGCPAIFNVYYNPKKEIRVQGCTMHNHSNEEVNFCKEKGHEHEMLYEIFQTFDDAMEYVNNSNLLATFRIRNTSPGKFTMTRYFICSCLGHYQARTSTKKIVDNCPAYFNIRSTRDKVTGQDNQTILSGCLTHSHQFEPALMRMTPTLRQEILAFLNDGRSKKSILKNFYNWTELDVDKMQHKPLIMEDIRRLERRFAPKVDTLHLPSNEALIELVKLEKVRIFNFNSILGNAVGQFDRDSMHKWVQIDEGRFLLMSMSERQREVFRKNPFQLSADGTHATNNQHLILVTLSILDERGEGFQIAHILMTTENHQLFQIAMEKLYELEPEACLAVTVFMSDITNVFTLGWQRAVPNSRARFLKCSWHIGKIFIKNSKNLNKHWQLCKLATDLKIKPVAK